ncbi:UDP-3-O-(3-hydroxymyristoyl)glucosamine N-acyltransferase [Desulforhopalus vacuolatus]|uniref:UDP-3-O-(3-hydroxymyristoyl)glucosamine N-acyltransferase n=1 Tax=Desulforhopalus vacuolatus TaxID=40414 RepID=UPI001963D102|nr:UDP-3-O-(3-hydroxymyristoyl)glucosamine N-acyltransferase [Desulforhopalus vacuolatus]MBM9519078.1 UDP-3-O-(3-hydroxymyristoyl)glucosamine N-acyltransferase [Desulforhopalus vacuolatus]
MKKIITIEELAKLASAEVAGESTKTITGFAPLETAGPEEVSFLVDAKWADKLVGCRAGAIFVPKDVESLPCDAVLLHVRDPYLAGAIIHNFFLATPFAAQGVHPRAFVGEGGTLGKEVTIAPLAVIGNRVKIGERVEVASGAVIGDDVVIGDDCVIHANVSVYKECILGDRVIVHSGTVIGSDGYGYAPNERGEHIKRPQVGIVRIENDVEIGANCTLDRAAYGETVIKSGAKIDNLVQIGHNVVVGENCLLVSQVGLAGSTILGRNVVMGGQAASAGHLSVGDRTMIAARGAVHADVPADSRLGGAPAIPVKQWARACAVFAKLPELHSAVRKNTRALAKISALAKITDSENN